MAAQEWITSFILVFLPTRPVPGVQCDQLLIFLFFAHEARLGFVVPEYWDLRLPVGWGKLMCYDSGHLLFLQERLERAKHTHPVLRD